MPEEIVEPIDITIKKYFECLYGENYTLTQVLTYEQLNDFLGYHDIIKEFLIENLKRR